MTDKEKRIFEEWFEEKKEKCEVYGNGDDFWVDDEIKKFCLMGYELGLKAGRPQWHKVPNDLPKENKVYFVAIKDNGLAIAYFNGLNWETKYNLGDFGHCVETVIAWCEIPTFDKE